VSGSVKHSSSPSRLRLSLSGGLLVVLMWVGGVRVATAAGVRAAMKTPVVEPPEFSVIGIQVRTNNGKETAAGGAIPRQWERFFKEAIADKIPHKVGSSIYAVYTGYASDRDGEYDFIIGMKVSRVSEVSRGDGCDQGSKRQICGGSAPQINTGINLCSAVERG